ncbi:MAG TPA: glycosyltransferase family 1 protein, partial [Chitinophagaceae bacterium]|nr:glycosyltransferase family 1 protein [Chitinophagaceae bacterium]
MNIAFDAKRAFSNTTGLGNYSRTLIQSLAAYYPQHEYFLCAPKLTDAFPMYQYKNLHSVTPQKFPSNFFTSAWRSSWVKNDLKKLNVDLYHGLSHEVPVGIQKTNIKSVVTIHDLIFERYPEQYHPIDVFIYRRKFQYACRYADAIIAISEQTKKDIIEFYKISEEKITVCYQSCIAAFGEQAAASEKEKVKSKNGLPAEFFLYVGSVIERKNLLTICKALHALKDKLDIPLVVIGDGDNYMNQV